MKALVSISTTILFLTAFAINTSQAVLPMLWRGCGTTCGKAELLINKPSTSEYICTVSESATLPSLVDITGTYYYIIKLGSTTIYSYSKSYSLYNAPVTSIGGGLKRITFDMSTALSPDPLHSTLDVSPGSYNLYVYNLFTVYSGGIPLLIQYTGSLTTPVVTDLAGTTYPIVVTANMVQNSNTPTSLKVDGYTLDPSNPTTLYSCKSTFPLRVDFATVTECRTYTIKVDYAMSGCSSNTFSPGTAKNLNMVYDIYGNVQNYLEYSNFNDLAAIINPSNNGITFRLRITISNTGPTYCSSSTIYRCITISGAAASNNLELVAGGSYVAPTTNWSLAPTLGYVYGAFNAARNANFAVESFNIKIEAGSSTSGPWITVYNNIYNTPLSGGIPDVLINKLPAGANASFASYPGRSNTATGITYWGVDHGFLYYKLTVQVINGCNPPSPIVTGYFKLNPSVELVRLDGEMNPVSYGNPVVLNDIKDNQLITDDFISNLNLEVYPNPFTSEVTFNHLGRGSQIIVYDFNQKIIANVEVNSDSYTFNTDRWGGSIFFYRILNKDGSVIDGKIIKIL